MIRRFKMLLSVIKILVKFSVTIVMIGLIGKIVLGLLG